MDDWEEAIERLERAIEKLDRRISDLEDRQLRDARSDIWQLQDRISNLERDLRFRGW